MNVYDSHRMADTLAAEGFAETAHPEDANLVILNTCHIREKAADKVYSELGRIRVLKEAGAREGRRVTIAVAGCVAQAEGEEIMRRQPAVDLVVGPQAYHQLPELIARAHRAKGERLAADFTPEDKFDALAPTGRRPSGVTAFLTVQEGCDKFCTFCVVPYTRGGEWSRPPEAIEAEARALADQGVREVTLLGQNVNAYRGTDADGRGWNLARLIGAIAELKDVWRIRYTTSHPRDMDDDLIAAHGEVETLMPYLHLPVQSGSDRVLAAMNRGHSRDDYRRLADRIRNARADIALSSDFIVGFPGETDKDFETTMALVREVNFAASFSFKYSARPGTPAAVAARQIPDEVKSERLTVLQALLTEQQHAFNQGCWGKVLPVLFEKLGRKQGQAVGRSPYLQPVHVAGAEMLIGEIRDVEIASVLPNSLRGVFATEVPTPLMAIA